MDIIWSCVSVLLVCTYKCVHPNIPSFEEKRAGWHKIPRLGLPYCPERPMLRVSLRRLKVMMVILVAPEVGVAMSALEYTTARNAIPEDAQDVGLTHGFYASMGGFALKIRKPESDAKPGKSALGQNIDSSDAADQDVNESRPSPTEGTRLPSGSSSRHGEISATDRGRSHNDSGSSDPEKVSLSQGSLTIVEEEQDLRKLSLERAGQYTKASPV